MHAEGLLAKTKHEFLEVRIRTFKKFPLLLLVFFVNHSDDFLCDYTCGFVGFVYSETFSFVLTDVDGNRRFGYCRRLLV